MNLTFDGSTGCAIKCSADAIFLLFYLCSMIFIFKNSTGTCAQHLVKCASFVVIISVVFANLRWINRLIVIIFLRFTDHTLLVYISVNQFCDNVRNFLPNYDCRWNTQVCLVDISC